MIYTGYREESFSYRRVRWNPGGADAFHELEEYGVFSGGTLEFSADAELVASGSLDYDGESLPETHDLLRIRYTFTDQAGETGTEVLGTFFPILSDPSHEMGSVSGSVNLQSVLRVLLKGKTTTWYVVPRGTAAVETAVEIVEGMGLPTNRPAPGYRLQRAMRFEPGTTWLAVANALLDAASYAPLRPDAMGGVVMAPRRDGTEEEPVATFSSGPLSIMEPEVVLANDSADTANVVCLIYEGERTLWATARNTDPSSPSSIPAKGYEITVVETVTELAGDSPSAQLAALRAMAADRLIGETRGTEYVEWRHPWVPIFLGDPVGIDYPESSILWKGAVSHMRVTIDGSIDAETRAQKQVGAGFKYEVEGGWW